MSRTALINPVMIVMILTATKNKVLLHGMITYPRSQQDCAHIRTNPRQQQCALTAITMTGAQKTLHLVIIIQHSALLTAGILTAILYQTEYGNANII